MKRILNIILVLAGVALAVLSCKKEETYKPAPQEEGAQVYFSKDLPTSYNLKDYDTNYFTFEILRVDSTQDLTVSLKLSGADSIFSIPSSVKFAAGETARNVTVTWDTTAVEEGIKYALSVKIKNDTTGYAKSQYDFTAEWPASCILWKKGHIYEVCWEEDYDAAMYYQETEYDNIWYCKIEDAWWKLDETGMPVEAVGDYYFYWDTKKNSLYIPSQHVGLYSGGEEIYVSTAAEFYNLYFGYGYDIPSQKYFDWALGFNDRNGFNNGYYDGKGGFYLGDWMYKVNGGIPTGNGWQFGGDQDYFIAEGFVRTIDYNDKKHIGLSTPLYHGIDTSYFWSSDGGKTPYIGYLSLRYTKDTVKADTTTTYYIDRYFGENYCLAFTAPKTLQDGSPITNVENDQPTGTYTFGEEVWFSVKGGTVSFPEGSKYPTFKITLRVYTKDADGNKLHDFGNIEETFVADEEMHYSLYDFNGGDYGDYLGTWRMTSYDVLDGRKHEYDITISDGGYDPDSTMRLFAIANLANLNRKFPDTVYSYYDEYFGAMVVPTQTLKGKYRHLKEDCEVRLRIYDPDSGKSYDDSDVLGGICNDGSLAFMNRSRRGNLCGFDFYVPELEASLREVYYVEESGAGSAPDASKLANGFATKGISYKDAPVNNTTGNSVFTKVGGTRDDSRMNSPRTFTLTPKERASRHSMGGFSPSDLIVR